MAQNSYGDLPLHVAANTGHLSIVRYLFPFSYAYQEQLKSENPESSDDTSAVESSIQQQLNDLTSEPLKNNKGNTPLHLALIRKYEEVDVNLKSKYAEVAEFLMKRNPRVCYCGNYAGMSPKGMAEDAEDADLLKRISCKSPPYM